MDRLWRADYAVAATDHWRYRSSVDEVGLFHANGSDGRIDDGSSRIGLRYLAEQSERPCSSGLFYGLPLDDVFARADRTVDDIAVYIEVRPFHCEK